MITDCTRLAQQTKKTSQQNPFAHHHHSVKVSDDVSWQDKIGLHQFDNYLSQVKINIFIFQQDSAKTHRVCEAFLACNLAKCLLILKYFYEHT